MSRHRKPSKSIIGIPIDTAMDRCGGIAAFRTALADAGIKVSIRTINAWRRGEYWPTPDRYASLARVLATTPQEIASLCRLVEEIPLGSRTLNNNSTKRRPADFKDSALWSPDKGLWRLYYIVPKADQIVIDVAAGFFSVSGEFLLMSESSQFGPFFTTIERINHRYKIYITLYNPMINFHAFMILKERTFESMTGIFVSRESDLSDSLFISSVLAEPWNQFGLSNKLLKINQKVLEELGDNLEGIAKNILTDGKIVQSAHFSIYQLLSHMKGFRIDAGEFARLSSSIVGKTRTLLEDDLGTNFNAYYLRLASWW